MILPANPNSQVSSVGLPVIPGNYLAESGGCGGPELHVLAIGTRTVPQPDSQTSAWTGAYSGPMDEAITPAGGSINNWTLREALAVSVPGSGQVRVRLSNDYATQPVTFNAATIAAQSGGAAITDPQTLTFGSPPSDSVTIPAGGDVYSNGASIPAGGTGLLTVSLYVAPASSTGGIPSVTSVPIHDTPNVVTYYASGNGTTDPGTAFTNANSLQGLYYVSAIDVSDSAPSDGTVAVLGDQAAAGAPAWTQGTWPSDLPGALSTAGVPLPGAVADVSTSGTSPDHWWQLNDSGLDGQATAFDSGPGPWDNLTLEKTATWGTGPASGTSSGSLSLDGSAGYAATSGPVIGTTGSFTVSAWVKLPATVPSGYLTLLAQDANVNSGFYLAKASNGDWDFEFPNVDATGAVVTNIYGPAVAGNTWTHLAGVYNASTNTATLYVNGAAVGSATVTPFASNGPLQVGRCKWGGGYTDYFPGQISDVREFNSALSGTGVSKVYNDTGTSVITSANAQAAVSSSVSAEPNLRDVIIAVGANDVLQGDQIGAIEGNLGNLITTLKGYYASDTGNPAQVIVTTIPPLGLPANDANDTRESVRLAVNNWIMGGNSCGPASADNATLNVDIACAVQAQGSSNEINSAYLDSNGVPNAAYYSAVAAEFAKELSNAINTANLINGL